MIAFVRHGQTASNRGGQLQGRFDAPLTPEGEAQAERVAAALESEAPVRVVTSPLQRARETAEAIATRIGVEVEIDDRLVELDYGEWDQRLLTDVPAEVWREWRAAPSFAPPGGESLEAVTARVVDFCTARLDEWRDDLLVAVSHVSPIKVAVCWALGVDERVSWRMQLGLATITRIGCVREDTPHLLSFNETSHL
ncbi:MAG: alpha-ribazole phosphatase [Actinomycetota bacterium]|nr:alpha-ribazole phosphatase [Actinomycetota bacterium]